MCVFSFSAEQCIVWGWLRKSLASVNTSPCTENSCRVWLPPSDSGLKSMTFPYKEGQLPHNQFLWNSYKTCTRSDAVIFCQFWFRSTLFQLSCDILFFDCARKEFWDRRFLATKLCFFPRDVSVNFDMVLILIRRPNISDLERELHPEFLCFSRVKSSGSFLFQNTSCLQGKAC